LQFSGQHTSHENAEQRPRMTTDSSLSFDLVAEALGTLHKKPVTVRVLPRPSARALIHSGACMADDLVYSVIAQVDGWLYQIDADTDGSFGRVEFCVAHGDEHIANFMIREEDFETANYDVRGVLRILGSGHLLVVYEAGDTEDSPAP
jgi:hypothetical protein